MRALNSGASRGGGVGGGSAHNVLGRSNMLVAEMCSRAGDSPIRILSKEKGENETSSMKGFHLTD